MLGALHVGLVCWWVLASLLRTTALALPMFLTGLALVGAVAALAGRALHHGLTGLRIPLWIALPVSWTGYEWALAHLPGTLAFPWLGLGTSLTGFPELVGIAELVGARGVGFWIASVNGLLASALLVRGAGEPGERASAPFPVSMRFGVAALAVALLPMAWGVIRARSLETRPAARVAVVQTDVAGDLRRLAPEEAADSARAGLDRLFPRIAPGEVALAVLPEAVLPIDVLADGARDHVSWLQRHARELGAPVLFGALGPGEGGTVHNSAFLMEPGGLADWRYDKRHLVPFVERAPALGLPLVGRGRDPDPYAAGVEIGVARVDALSIGVLVCFESAFADDARRLRAEGVDLLVNVTSDAWFGTDPGEARTTVLWQHPAHMVMRAIENRVGVVRAANRGISLFVEPTGRIRGATGTFTEGLSVADVSTTDVVTLYARWGDVTGRACAAAALLLLLTALATEVRARPERMRAD